jgi:aspartokinase/homoserine dehydrogenase 1
MFVHALGSAALGSSAQVCASLRLMHAEAARGPAIIVVTALPGVMDLLMRAADMAVSGEAGDDGLLREIERRHFEIIRDAVDLKRQSGAIAGVRQQVNQLGDILDGISLLRELSQRTRDMVTAWGEWLAAYVFFEGLKEIRASVRLLDTRDLVVTDDRFTHARIKFAESRERILRAFGGSAVTTVVPGGVGATVKGDITTLGRAGSKLVASTIAAALKAQELVVWTCTDGILTADPGRVATARPISCMSYVEAMELMHFSGDFLYPPSLIPAMKHGIPICVRNAFNPEFAGTMIRAGIASEHRFTGISSMDEIALLQIQGGGMVGVTGIAMRLFSALAGAGVNVILISQASSEHSICVGISSADASRAKRAVEESFAPELDEGLIDDVSVEDGLAIVAVVGERMKHTMGLAAIIFGTLGEAKVNVKAVAQGSSELNVSIVIDAADQQRALEALHRSLIEGERKLA